MQLRTSKTIESFHDTLKKKFGFDEYTSTDEPTLFFGIYSRGDRRAIEEHNGIKIVSFAGSDSEKLNDISFLKGATVIAESRWIEKDLDAVGVEYESISLCMDDLYAWPAEPLGDSLYWYGAHNSKYGKRYLQDVQNAFPDLNIITHDHGTVPRSEMPEVYKQCFAGVRAVEHDGMSQTVAEMALMGRMSIWNGGGPFSVPYEGVEGIIEAIKELRKGYNHKLISKRARGYFIDNEIKWADLVLKMFGTDELGISNIFHEDVGRCGSIFRIQRRSDIEKIGGLGTDQFERPWFSNQMQKLGKKQLITSKSSGWVATEWKGAENKGYPEGFKDFKTYDKKYS